MKTLLILFVLLFSSSVFAEVYFCSEKYSIGFDKSDNMKSQEFKLRNFTININFKQNTISTDEAQDDIYLGFDEFIPSECVMFGSSEIYCINSLGVAFSFNEKIKKFNYASILKDDENEDDEWISSGTCSKF